MIFFTRKLLVLSPTAHPNTLESAQITLIIFLFGTNIFFFQNLFISQGENDFMKNIKLLKGLNLILTLIRQQGGSFKFETKFIILIYSRELHPEFPQTGIRDIATHKSPFINGPGLQCGLCSIAGK